MRSSHLPYRSDEHSAQIRNSSAASNPCSISNLKANLAQNAEKTASRTTPPLKKGQLPIETCSAGPARNLNSFVDRMRSIARVLSC